MRRILIVLSGLYAVMWAGLSGARAQPLGRTIIILEVSSEGPSSETMARQIESAIAERRAPLISMHEGRDRVAAVSQLPASHTEHQLREIAQESKNAQREAADGDLARTERTVENLVRTAERALETFNRDSARARQLLDACLAHVRALLQANSRRAGIERAMQCRRLVPDLAPRAAVHPAPVIGVLAEAEDELRRMRSGQLSVQDSLQRNCSVFLNGRHLGTTPYLVEASSEGLYAIQVECGSMSGRVHKVHLGERPVQLTIDQDFDASLRRDSRLTLQYATTGQARNQRLVHALLLARMVMADDVLVISRSLELVRALRVNAKLERIVAAVQVQASSGGLLAREDLEEALDALVQGRFVGVQPTAPAGHTQPLRGLAWAAAGSRVGPGGVGPSTGCAL